MEPKGIDLEVLNEDTDPYDAFVASNANVQIEFELVLPQTDAKYFPAFVLVDDTTGEVVVGEERPSANDIYDEHPGEVV